MNPEEIRVLVVGMVVVLGALLVSIVIYDRIERRKTHKWVERRLGGKR